MTLEQQVCSLDLAKRLKELGVKQESLFMWSVSARLDGSDRREKLWLTEKARDLVILANRAGALYSAFTVGELGEMLMDGRLTQYCFKQTQGWGWKSFTLLGTPVVFTEYSDTEADARAKMRIYLLENKLITL